MDEHWEEAGTYRFDGPRPASEVFSIDTPPPTVSGSLHIGHVFSATPTPTPSPATSACGDGGLLPDGVGRQRAAHRAPGAELLRGALRPLAPLRPGLRAARGAGPRTTCRSVRPNFIELCHAAHRARTSRPSRTRGGGSACRWTGPRATPRSTTSRRRTSQRMFLRNLCAAGEAYTAEAPTLWDVDFQTAVAQAEMEDRETARRLPPAALPAGQQSEIETTRPELLPACVALVAHPDDERYRRLLRHRRCSRRSSASRCRSLAHQLAEPDKGSGIAMICTFGDITDVDVVARARPARRARIVGRDGRLRPASAEAPPPGVPDGDGRVRASSPAGPSSRPSGAMVELLAAVGRARRASPGPSRTR